MVGHFLLIVHPFQAISGFISVIDVFPLVVSFCLTLFLGIEVLCKVTYNVDDHYPIAIVLIAVWCSTCYGGVCADTTVQACST